MPERPTHPYEEAFEKLEPHISRASDGTLVIDAKAVATVDIDQIILGDLLRSMEHTNEMIRRGEIKSEDLEDV